MQLVSLMIGAEGGTRTRTGLLPHAPETCASTNSTTSALKKDLFPFQESKDTELTEKSNEIITSRWV